MSRSRSQTGKSDHQIDLFAEDIAAETPTVPAAGAGFDEVRFPYGTPTHSSYSCST